MAVTGTFNPKRGDDDDAFEYDASGFSFTDRVGELELVVADPGSGSGKAITLWMLGELMVKTKGGQGRYDKVVAITDKTNMKNILTNVGFDFTACREVEDDGSYRDMRQNGNSDKMYKLDVTTANLQHVRNVLRNDRPGLYDICPPGGPAYDGVSGWPVCK